MNELRIENLSFGYNDVVLGKVDSLTLKSGRIHYLIGSNGIGKSTLMKTIAGHIPPVGMASIQLNQEDLSEMSAKRRAEKVAYVHRSRVNSRITVQEFLMIGLGSSSSRQVTRSEMNTRIAEYCSTRELSHLLNKFIGQISDGEYQKVLIALNVLRRCPVLLLDEPLSHLDPPSQSEMMTLFKKLSDKLIVFISTHNLDVIKEFDGELNAITPVGFFQNVEYQDFKRSSFLDKFYVK